MGKKPKIGKQRRDKYYQLAKEAGYRSRAAFKLIQLNRRFEFLQQCRTLVDLCAAPGGWLQVAAQHMPVSSLRIGVDLVPIRPIPNCITLVGDITEEKTRQLVRKELQTWEADCVLHDGAPNMGVNWIHDAFQQNCLTLQALRLATQVLRKGAYFVTKLFRSADYQPLVAVFEKLFKKVHVWKPEASRLESAEIFVVCEGYLKPQKIDSELLDAKKVFKHLPDEKPAATNQLKLLLGRKKEKKAKAEGYADGELSCFRELNASEFLQSGDVLQRLCGTSCIVIDTNEIAESPHTTQEIRECIGDIKVLGARELRAILAWRKRLLADRRKAAKLESAAENSPVQNDECEPEDYEEMREIEEMEEMDEAVRNAAGEEKTKAKRVKRKAQKEKARHQQREEYEMNQPQADLIQQDDIALFSLRSLKKRSSSIRTDRPTGEIDYDEKPTVEEKPKVLTPEELAMGEQMIYSSKSRRDLEEWGWNRYTNNDSGLPSWFREDEQKHYRKDLPVNEERVAFYKKRQMELNARPIMKVVQAKLRKKRRTVRLMEKARKRANNLADNPNLTSGERVRELKSIYKKALGTRKKKSIKYQVMTKGKRGRMERPDGPYKVVDRRLKSDNRSGKAKVRQNSKRTSRGKKAAPRRKGAKA